ncbi:unnamed protein product, partial [Brenthis ino]
MAPTDNIPNGIRTASEPISSKLFLSDEEPKHEVAGSVMDGLIMEATEGYTVYRTRWFMLAFFVLYSASNSLQWTQYTIISDIIVKYYGVKSHVVSWTSMVYMITYVPLIFPASWLLDKTENDDNKILYGDKLFFETSCYSSASNENLTAVWRFPHFSWITLFPVFREYFIYRHFVYELYNVYICIRPIPL